jgi:tRNA (guanine-N7-)-methyltransferase
VASYADEALARFLAHSAFDWTAERAADWNTQPKDHEATRYQLKGLGDCAPVWLEFIRR